MTCFFSSVIFKKYHGFIEEGNPSEKTVLVEEEPDNIDKEDIGNLVYSPILVFIDEECGNL